MPNLRIISDNAVSRSSLTASTTAGSLAASNLLTDIKGNVWRSTATAATLTADWVTGEAVGGVALPHTNLTQAATIRVRLYSDGGVTLLYDSGAMPACPAAPIKLRGRAAGSTGVNAFAYGGGAAARLWFPQVSGIKRAVVDLSDAGNSSGYIEASRLVIGDYWSPAYNADVGVSLTPKDESTHTRTDASDLITSIGTRSREMSLTLSNMHEVDRAALISIVRGNGKSVPMLFSLFPEYPVPELERDHEIYCKLSDISAMTIQYFDGYSAPLVLDEA